MNIKELIPAREVNTASRARVSYARTLKPGAHVHITGICGSGTSAVLSLLKGLGFYVTGSDKAFYPPMGERVRSIADKVFEGYRAENLNPAPALVVIGNALSRGNPEVEYLLDIGLPFASMPEVFEALLIGERDYCPTSVVVAGTHGKTTTTAAIAFLLEGSGRKPAYFIGGMPLNLPGNISSVSLDMPVEQRVVVLEGDEYDSAFFAKYAKFQHYRPDIAVITSLEFDHGDIYNSIEEIEAEFTRFARRVPKDGMLLVCDQGPYLSQLAERWNNDAEIKASIVKYGKSEQSKYRLLSRTPWCFQDIPKKRYGQKLLFNIGGQEVSMHSILSGEHNALNLLAAMVVCRFLGVGGEELEELMPSFAGVRRRQQILGEICGVLIIEDFAHHPTAVKATIEGLKEIYPERRLIAAFEPRSNTSRRSFFQDQYAASFAAADLSILREVEDPGVSHGSSKQVVALDVKKLIEDIGSLGQKAHSFKTIEDIEAFILAEARPGDLVLLMSNGYFGGLAERLPHLLNQRLEKK